MAYQVYELEPLGATPPLVGGASDPIRQYGERAAEYILARLELVGVDQRAGALELALRALDPTLPARVARKERKFISQGEPPDRAQRRAIAAALSEGMLKEVVALGRKSPKARSLIGVGAYEALGVVVRDHRITEVERAAQAEATRQATQYKYGRGTDADPWRFPPAMIAGTSRDHRIIALAPFKAAYNSAISRYGQFPTIGGLRDQLVAGVKSGTVPFITFIVAQSAQVMGRTVTRGQKYGVYYNESYKTMALKKIPARKRGLMKSLGSALKGIGKGIIALPKTAAEMAVKGAKKLYDAAKDVVDKLGDLACGVMSHPAAGAAAAGGAAAYGAPPQVGAVGVGVAKEICGGAGVPGVPPEDLMPPARGLPGWVLPVALGGGALVLVLALRRRR